MLKTYINSLRRCYIFFKHTYLSLLFYKYMKKLIIYLYNLKIIN